MCWFRTDASVRGGITWEDVCALTIPVPPISEQRKIVHDYQVITDRIELLRKIDNNLFQTAKAYMTNCHVEIYENKSKYPNFDWVTVDYYNLSF
jgi:type I restriction enzyme S subunit